MNDQLSEALFSQLAGLDKPLPGGDWLDENFLKPISEGDLSSAGVLADYLEEELKEYELAEKVRELTSPAYLREAFSEIRREQFTARWQPDYRPWSNLDQARKRVSFRVRSLFPGSKHSPDRLMILAVNDFTRSRMREDGFARRLLPPVEIPDGVLSQDAITGDPVKVLD